MSEMENFIFDLSLLGMAVLFGALMVSIAHSGLEHLYWRWIEWKTREKK